MSEEKNVDKTYVYDGSEVVLTGRKARKQLRQGRYKYIFEIRPLSVDADNNQFNSWVYLSDLFEIQDEEND